MTLGEGPPSLPQMWYLNNEEMSFQLLGLPEDSVRLGVGCTGSGLCLVNATFGTEKGQQSPGPGPQRPFLSCPGLLFIPWYPLVSIICVSHLYPAFL